ncbi:MAG TPA: hypothetical protein VGM94_05025 [Galbitalea sp.]
MGGDNFDGAQTLVYVVASLGSTGVLGIVVRGIFQTVTGKAAREKARNNEYLARSLADAETARKAQDSRDAEAVKRRLTQEYASELRRQAIENGYTPVDWPSGLEKTLTSAEVRKLRTSKPTKEKS